MTVEEMIIELQKQDPKAQIGVSVSWAGDTAVSDPTELYVKTIDGEVRIKGWMSNCDTSLEIGESEDED
jgi:hypothetical protein